MDKDKLVEQVRRDALEGIGYAVTATAEAGNQNSEEYIRASQKVISTLNRALGHATTLFLQSKRIAPDESHNERIHQLRISKHCPLDQSQINALFETNHLRNQLEHSKPPSIELWQVQRAAATVYTALPLLVSEEPWTEALKDIWREYRKQFGGSEFRESAPHNLPRPEYTSFVGRDAEIAQLFEALEHPRHWLVSIDGIGGVGKSALAMKIAWDMTDQIKQGISPWRYIIWLSAKSDRLPATATGIEPIKPDFQVLEDLFDQILLVTGFPEYVEKDMDSKHEAVTLVLESEPILLFVDNFETVEDQSILKFLDNLPGADLRPVGHKIILTTRHRETFGKRIRLEGLAEWEAKKLIRHTAKEFGVRQYFKDDEVVNRVIRETGSIPLALRWVVGQVSLGRSVGDVLTKMGQRTEDIHRFCFDATIAELDDAYLKTLYVLSQLRAPAEVETIASISGFTLEEMDNYLGTLLRYSLINRTFETVWEIDLYQLLPLTATYCAGLASRWPEYAKDVTKRAKIEGKRQRTLAVANGIYKRYGAYNEDERVAVAAATAAREEYRHRNLEKALKMLEDAKALSPKLGYIHLVEAQILAGEERLPEARDSFEQAYKLDPQSVEILKSWGELELSTGKFAKSAELFEQACELQPDDVGLRLLLAQATIRNAKLSHLRGQKQQGNKLFSAALRHARAALVDTATTVAQKQHNVKCYQAMIEVYQKRGNTKQALKICKEALEIDPDSFTLRSLANALESSMAESS